MTIETFDCLGEPIRIFLRGKRNPMYLDLGQVTDGRRVYRSLDDEQGKAETLKAAVRFRQNPGYFRDVTLEGSRDNASEWAFVLEQLVGEGTL
jgi:hypothetical protein